MDKIHKILNEIEYRFSNNLFEYEGHTGKKKPDKNFYAGPSSARSAPHNMLL